MRPRRRFCETDRRKSSNKTPGVLHEAVIQVFTVTELAGQAISLLAWARADLADATAWLDDRCVRFRLT